MFNILIEFSCLIIVMNMEEYKQLDQFNLFR